MPSGPARLVVSPSAASRLGVARAWLREVPKDADALVLATTQDAALQVARDALGDARFGCHRMTLARLAGTLAQPALARRGLVTVSPLGRQAVCAHLVLSAETLGRFAPLQKSPGLPRALARTLEELRLEGIASDGLADEDLAALMRAYAEALDARRLADRATVLEAATEAARGESARELLGGATLLVDVAIASKLERELVRALLARAERALVVVPEGDERTLAQLRAIGLTDTRAPAADTPLEALQARLFTRDGSIAPKGAGEAVQIVSAPGESRECVELARHVLREAAGGTPFDRMAILLRAPEQYRAHLEEALRRAKIPAHFARGAVRPNPSGRAFVALLACAAEGLRATRFAEYLSLGEVPDAADGGAPPQAVAATERWVAPDDELAPDAVLRNAPQAEDEGKAPEPLVDPEAAPVIGGTLRTPRLWEQLLVDAAVIGGIDRWKRRLDGLEEQLSLDLRHDEEKNGGAQAPRLRRQLDGLAALRAFCLPLLADLESLPKQAPWRVWLERLGALATRALRHPETVLSTLVELNPMADVADVTLSEVRLVLERRLTETITPPEGRRYGRVYVASIDEARGMDFDVVLVPGLAEKMFPQKVIEDPILPDPRRAAFEGRLRTNADRAAAERLALRIALGAATKRLVVSYPRLDVEQARPRTPSFYGLEVLHASEGKLGGFEDFARRADTAGDARIGWPAPRNRAEAIDEAEHDLSLLESVLRRPEQETEGMARYLIGANPHLARALRARYARWQMPKWTNADGLVDPAPAAREALKKHAIENRSFSPTALQNFAACPYRFLLQAIHRLAPREEPVALEELDPLQRGTLVHEVEFELSTTLRDQGLLPVTSRNFAQAREALEKIVAKVAKEHEDALCPAIDRVWEDGIASILADLVQALRQTAEDPSWKPAHFELSFGLKERRAADPHSREEPVEIDCGLRLRGSIDLIERRDAEIRATDYKTGKVRTSKTTVIEGGEILQPVLYALVLEKIFPGEKVFGGRLWYCTAAGEFKEHVVPLDDDARGAAKLVADTIRDAITQGFLPAAPKERACEYCDYNVVCGPYEETRTKRKRKDRLQGLVELRKRP